MLKIAIKLRETNVLNFDQSFYEEMKSVVKLKEICALKLLIKNDLNVH